MEQGYSSITYSKNENKKFFWGVAKIFSGVVIPVISLIIGFTKYFSNNNIQKEPQEIVFSILFIIVLPAISLLMSQFILNYEISKTNDSIFEASQNIRAENNEFVGKVNTLISESITRSNHFSAIHFHEYKELLIKFVPLLIKDFNDKLQALSIGHLYENDPSKYQKFCSDIFNLATPNQDTIQATSVVDTIQRNGFWEDKNTIQYLKNNKKMIDRGIRFERYFFVDNNTKESSRVPIANNLAAKVDVFIIDLDSANLNEQLIKDCGLIGDGIVIESQVDSSKNIYKVDIYFGNKDKYSEISSVFDALSIKHTTVENYYGLNKEDMILRYANIPFE